MPECASAFEPDMKKNLLYEVDPCGTSTLKSKES
jgi:hypothetical protein